jgi:hypothetical protein
MPRPGVSVSLLELPGAVSVPTDTGVWFVTGLTERGPVTPTLVVGLNDFANKFGDRVSYSVLYDAMETYFREGGNRAYISRVVGPAATNGVLNLTDGTATVSLVATANGPGAWSASYRVAVVAGTTAGTFIIRVQDSSGNILEDSGELLDQAAAVAWGLYSRYIRLTLGASALDPAPLAATAMSAGSDDRASITDTHWATALDKFDVGLGPGQVSAPGRTTTASYSQITAHAEARFRVALLDMVDSGTVATLLSSAASMSKSRMAARFAPWLTIPGVVVNTLRTVPPTALAAGLISKNDHALGANFASAGNAGVSNFAVDLTQQSWNDIDRDTLNTAGINVIRRMYDGIRVYGWRSTANAQTDRNWLSFGNSRLYMALVAELNAAGENYMFDPIDGQTGDTITSFGESLTAVLDRHFVAGELFGNAKTAYAVDVGPTINTLETIANLELHGVCYVRMSPFAEWVKIEIVKNRIA